MRTSEYKKHTNSICFSIKSCAIIYKNVCGGGGYGGGGGDKYVT